MQQLSPNSLLQGGKYRIEKVLGQGGFGITYLGVQVALNRKVAIKEFFMKEYCNRDEETSHVSVPSEGSKELVGKFRAKFVKEAQNIACLNHPHIIRIYDIFEENGTAYYVMEYWDHGSLGDHVKSHGRLPEAEALRYIRQVAEALDYIHQRKMNHLDVKPGNILLDEAHNAVLIDFGLSKRYDAEGNQTSTTPVGISHGYAPLEQYKRGGVGTFSPATDVYSLGATLYKLLTGETPPEANDVMDEGLPAFPASVTATTVSAIEKAMQPAKKNRPQSIGEFMALLGMGEEPIKKETEEDEETKIDVDEEETKLVAEEPKPAPAPKPQPQPKPTPAPKPELKVTEVTEPKSSSRKTWVISLSVVAVALIWLLWPKGGNDVAPSPRPAQQTSVTQSQPAPVVVHEETPAPSLLYVTTSPSGATVYVDGKKVGTTPIEGKEIDRGSHTVKISKSGYETISEKKTFGDKPVVLNETLTAEAKRETPVSSGSSRSAKKSVTSNGFSYTINGVTFNMVSVKGGTFQMGATSEQQSPDSDEKPVHSVTLSDYYIGETEVTQALWTAVMGSNPSNFKGDNLPVERVSWDDCQTFIRKLNQLTGATFRLPTEAEWEYAARGGNKSRGYQYSGSNNLSDVAWYTSNSGDKTHAVKTKQPNELGLYDMSGNVWEWCQDWYGDYTSRAQMNPTGPSSGSYRVSRGGGWYGDAGYCRVSNRYCNTPGNRGDNLGFRLSF